MKVRDNTPIMSEAGKHPEDVREFLYAIRNIPEADFFPILKETHTEVFDATDCLSCAACCKNIPPLVTEQDVTRLARLEGISKKQFMRHYVLTDLNGEMTLNGVPCRFLGEDNACRVYYDRPEACRRYPHTDEKPYQKRMALNLANVQVCPAANQIVLKLIQKFNQRI